MQRQLVEQANTDYLTGALNRRAFMATVEERRKGLDEGDDLALALLDIDRFKSVNDLHGHDVGDEVIAAVARIASEEAPIVARFGGEEFALAFPVLDAPQAAHWCDVIRRAIEATQFVGAAGPFHVTCSLGVSDWPAGQTLRNALKQADKALMLAKSRGRNQVLLAERRNGLARASVSCLINI